jgi:SAM-dependent methyltransferase
MSGKGQLNEYHWQLSAADIEAKAHRTFVGGMWDEMGALQFEFLRGRGLTPSDYLLDVGCGALRGGIHFARYLDEGHYFGIDSNSSLIDAGMRELQEAGLTSKRPTLLVNDLFQFGKFGRRFTFAIAQSLFSHLPMNHIVRCLVEIRAALVPNGTFYATFFEAPSSAYLIPLPHEPGESISKYDADPYHYSLEEFRWMAGVANVSVAYIGDWKHPRGQKMLSFTIPH